MLILVQKENEQDQAHIFKGRYFKSCLKHQLPIMYHLKHTNHGIHLDFLIRNL